MSEKDYRLIRELRGVGALADFQGQLIGTEGEDCVVGVFCGDAHRFRDNYRFLARCGCDKNIHTVTKNGGSLVIPACSPFARKVRAGQTIHKDLDVIDEIDESCSIKETRTIVCFAHFACGKAYAAGLNAAEVLRLHVMAKDRLRTEFPGAKVSCQVHVDYVGWKEESARQFSTYYLNRKALRAWARAQVSDDFYQLKEALAA